ncbi:uncharacterized protein [Aristolochia californica]|uniref:uncharacterized protein n=1 Tax=Aristolochia californica TaxID=171875 RepID=UPI0035E15D0B
MPKIRCNSVFVSGLEKVRLYRGCTSSFCVDSSMDPSSSSSPPFMTKHYPSSNLPRKTKSTVAFLYIISCILVVIIMQPLALQSIHHRPLVSKPRTELTFYPLKDPSVPAYRQPNKTWFMSSFEGHSIDGMPEHFVFPSSHPPRHRILCINAHAESYALAAAKNIFPANATVLRGITFVADSFYDYENPWHSLNALSVFFSWMMENSCAKPTRFVIFEKGKVVKKVGPWISALLKACLGGEVAIDSLEDYGIACFEKAVVMRRGLGKMSTERRHRLFEMIRCKAWKFCNAEKSGEREEEEEDGKGLRITVIGREGKRSFKNETEVKLVMERECKKVEGCRLNLVHLKNKSFCDQVKLMRDTDVVVTTHGAQLSNMMFMAKGSSVMEMFPKGWLEGAGVGQYIYRWFASWCEMRYEGAWRDTQTEAHDCNPPHPRRRSACFSKQKDGQVGINETFLALWTASVIQDRTRAVRSSNVHNNGGSSSFSCPCSV